MENFVLVFGIGLMFQAISYYYPIKSYGEQTVAAIGFSFDDSFPLIYRAI